MAGKPLGDVMGLKVGRSICWRLIHMAKEWPKYCLKKKKKKQAGKIEQNNRPHDCKIS